MTDQFAPPMPGQFQPGQMVPPPMPGMPGPAPQQGFSGPQSGVTVDFSKLIQEAKTASFDPVPTGKYVCRITKAEATVSSGGKPQIKLRARIEEGQYQGKSITPFNWTISEESPVSLSIFFRHMAAFGLTQDWFASLGQLPPDQALVPVAQRVEGQTVILSLDQDSYNGQARNKVVGVEAAAGVPQNVPQAGPVAPQAQVPQAPIPQAPQQPQYQPQPQAPVQQVAPQQPQAPAQPQMPYSAQIAQAVMNPQPDAPQARTVGPQPGPPMPPQPQAQASQAPQPTEQVQQPQVPQGPPPPPEPPY